jgi:cytochrome b pre-mRNA-processing protein 3
MATLWQSVKQWLGLQPAHEATVADALYVRAVAQARQPEWYTQGGVPDTLDGRFEMILLHLFALQERLERCQSKAFALAVQRSLSETFFRDMDRSLRELGVADTGIGRRIKNMAEAYFGRMQAYRTARSTPMMDGWTQALAKNVYGTAPVGNVHWLATQLERWFTTLEQMPDAELIGQQTAPLASARSAA